MKAILGKKVGMTQIFENDKVIPVTIIEAGPCKITDLKNVERHGYQAIQLGYGSMSRKNKAKKSQKEREFQHIKEFRSKDDSIQEKGSVVDVSVFEEGDLVQVSGISKGKGFQGGVKRHGMHGRKATHGVKHEERTIGSIGSAYPERVIKGRKMPGHMGAERVTVKKLTVAKVDKEHNILAVKGAVPGRRGTLLEIQG